jgi:hypothetical protein
MNGWQAVDATPQEKSEGVFQMGPAPLAAVKNFVDSAPWDTPFVVSEVSSKVHNYVQRCDDSGQNCNNEDMGIDPDTHVGTLIVSNPVGNVSDITSDYKQTDHILASRVPKKLKKMWRVSDDGDDDIAIFIEATNEPGFGEPIRLNAMFFGYNDSIDELVFADVHCYYTDYTGQILSNFKNFSITALLTSNNSNTYAWEMDISDFLYEQPVNVDFYFTLFALVNSTGVVLADTASLSLRLPSITVLAPQTIHVGVASQYALNFYNPLPVPLTNVVMRVRKIGMGNDDNFSISTVPARAPINIANQLLLASAQSVGRQSILATLFCDQFESLQGYVNVQVVF